MVAYFALKITFEKIDSNEVMFGGCRNNLAFN